MEFQPSPLTRRRAEQKLSDRRKPLAGRRSLPRTRFQTWLYKKPLITRSRKGLAPEQWNAANEPQRWWKRYAANSLRHLGIAIRCPVRLSTAQILPQPFSLRKAAIPIYAKI